MTAWSALSPRHYNVIQYVRQIRTCMHMGTARRRHSFATCCDERMLHVLIALTAAFSKRGGSWASSSPSWSLLQTPYTAPVDPTLRPETDFLPLNSGITADNSTGNEPSQIHLTIAGPNAISVNWATGKYKVCGWSCYALTLTGLYRASVRRLANCRSAGLSRLISS